MSSPSKREKNKGMKKLLSFKPFIAYADIALPTNSVSRLLQEK
jgi:hypothetical protein